MYLNSIPEMVSATVIALIALAFGIQHLVQKWRGVSTENSIMTLMHTELERMSKQNAVLSVELGKLQTEILALNTELRKLTTENQRLHAEVATLTSEVNRLQQMLMEYPPAIYEVQEA